MLTAEQIMQIIEQRIEVYSGREKQLDADKSFAAAVIENVKVIVLLKLKKEIEEKEA